MDEQTKLQQLTKLYRELSFLEDECENVKQLVDAIHPDVSPVLFLEQKVRVTQLLLSIEHKQKEIALHIIGKGGSV